MGKEKSKELLASSGFNHTFPLAKLTENDFDTIFERVGGVRIAEGKDSSADYRIGPAILEIKFLEREGNHSEVRQKKLSALFQPKQPTRPVVVLDDTILEDDERRIFHEIYKGTIQSHVRSARKQLRQSRKENLNTSCSILYFQNIGFAVMGHDDLFSVI